MFVGMVEEREFAYKERDGCEWKDRRGLRRSRPGARPRKLLSSTVAVQHSVEEGSSRR